MNKLIALAVIGISFLSIGKGVQSQTLRVLPAEGAAGTTVPVKIEVENVTGLNGLEFSFYYAAFLPTTAPLLNPPDTNLSPGPFWHPSVKFTCGPGYPGNLNVTFAKPEESRSGSGTILTIPVALPAGAKDGTFYYMQLLGVNATGGDGKKLPLKVKNSTLTVKAPSDYNPTLTLSGVDGVVTARPGRSFALRFRATGPLEGLKSIRFGLRYPSGLRFRDFSDPAWEGEGMVSIRPKGEGKFSVSFPIVPEHHYEKDGVGLILPFYLSPETPVGTALEFTPEEVALVDREGEVIPAALNATTVTAVEPPPSLPGKIKVGSVAGYPGEVVKVPVSADGGIAGVKGLAFRIPLGDSDLSETPYLDFDEMISPGTIWPEYTSIIGSGRRQMDADLSNYERPGSGPGSFVVLHMKIPEGTPPQKSYPLNLEDLRFVVGDEEERTGAFENGAIRVLCRRERGHVRRPGHSEEAVTVEDALLTLRALVGMEELTEEQQWAADMDGDNAVTVRDVVGILKVAVGLELPRCEG